MFPVRCYNTRSQTLCNRGIGRSQDDSAIAAENLQNMSNVKSISWNENKHIKEVLSPLRRNNLRIH